MACNILLYGASDSGKSTIANALIGEDTILGVTTQCQTVSDDEYTIIDTVGVKETHIGSVPHKSALFRIQKYIKELHTPLHHVCFVSKKEKELDLDSFKEFMDIFANCKDNIVIIVTHSNATWAKKNQRMIQERIGQNIPVIGIDFVENYDKSLEELEKRLQLIREKPGFTPKPVNGFL